MRPKLVVGCGSGRSGTFSLFRLLQVQKGFAATHEGFFLPWEVNDSHRLALWRQLERFRTHVSSKVNVVANVSFNWINYIPELMAHTGDTRVICLKRDKWDTVDSFIAHQPGVNMITDPACEYWEFGKWGKDPNKRKIKDEKGVKWIHTERQWPLYPLPKREAYGKYWEEYYMRAEHLSKKFPDNVKIFRTEDLNTEAGVTKILNHAGVWDEEMLCITKVRLNTRFKGKGNISSPDLPVPNDINFNMPAVLQIKGK